jgi:hypothetical protein
MSAQTTGGYTCNKCGSVFNVQEELDAHVREKHNTHSTTA